MSHIVADVKVERATKKLAKEYADMKQALFERPLRQSRVDYLLKEFEAGRACTCHWSIAYVEETGETYRVNGQHSSHVLAYVIDKTPNKLQVTISEYICETLRDLSDLYRTFDNPEAVRSMADTLRVDRAADGNLQAVSTGHLARMASGIALALNEGQSAKGVSRKEKADLLHDNPQFVKFFAGIYTTPKECKHINRAPVIGAMFATWRKNKGESAIFWIRVRDGENLAKNDPAIMLRDFLMVTVAGGSTGYVPGKRSVTYTDMYARCVTAWNAYRAKRKIKKLRFDKGRVPKAR